MLKTKQQKKGKQKITFKSEGIVILPLKNLYYYLVVTRCFFFFLTKMKMVEKVKLI